MDFSEPPTNETLEGARRRLVVTRDAVSQLSTKIDAAEATLAQIVQESQYAINELQAQRAELQKQVAKTLAYLSPIRRLPLELLREIFMRSFEDHPCSAWVLAAVCTSWRRLALRIPLIWSKVSTTVYFSALYMRPVGTRYLWEHNRSRDRQADAACNCGSLESVPPCCRVFGQAYGCPYTMSLLLGVPRSRATLN